MVVQKIIHLFIELDDGTIYRKALYPINLMVKTHGFPVDFPNKTNPMIYRLGFSHGNHPASSVVSIRGIHCPENRNGKRRENKRWILRNTQRIDVPRKMIEMHRKTTFCWLTVSQHILFRSFQWHESFTTLTKPRWSRYGPGRHKSLRTSGEGGRYVRVLRPAQGCHQNGADHIPGFVKPDQSICWEIRVFPCLSYISYSQFQF